MQYMTQEEYRQFLMGQSHTAKVATVRADGAPHVAPVWFTLDGDDILFTTGADTIKAANIRRDPRVSLSIDDEAPPFAYVRIDGTATLTEHAPDMLRWATGIAGRYMGADQAEAYGRRNAVAGELLVRVTPTKILAVKGIAD